MSAKKPSSQDAACNRHDKCLNAFVSIIDSDRLRSPSPERVHSLTEELKGMPVAIKDLIDVKGFPTVAGSPTRLKAPTAAEDAHVVRQLRRADMIVVAKTRTVELAFGGWGTNQTEPTPINPNDPCHHRCPGGSSSGSAVAVAAGFVPAALGTDTMGSIRQPAAFCGCVGVKPSFGLIGRTGILPLAPSYDTVGPLAANTLIAAQLLMAMQGADRMDEVTHTTPEIDTLESLEAGVSGLRLGAIFPDDLPKLGSEVHVAHLRELDRLRAKGATITQLSLPETLDEYHRRAGVVGAYEAYQNYHSVCDDLSSGLGAATRNRIASGRTISLSDYSAALRKRRQDIINFSAATASIDAVVLPTTPILAPPISEINEADTQMSLYTRFVNYLDLAATVVPFWPSGSTMPHSLQFVVRKFDDALGLRIARSIELEVAPERRLA